MADLDFIENALVPIISDLKKGLSLSFVLKNNFHIIQKIRNHGYSISTIHEKIVKERSCTLETFRNAISRARKFNLIKNNDGDLNPHQEIKNNDGDLNPHQEIKNNDGDLNLHQEQDYSDWIKAFAFNQPFNDKVLRVTIPDLIKGGWNTENYHILRDKFDILNYQQLSKVMGIIRSSKFRKSIYKDGKACF